MKILLLALALAGCEDFMAGYNHAKYGTPLPQTLEEQVREHEAYNATHVSGHTTLDDINDNLGEIRHQQVTDSIDAQERADEAEERANQ
jgi:hypothetical protein